MTTFGFYPQGDRSPHFSASNRTLQPEEWELDKLIDRLESAETGHFATESPALFRLSLEAIRHSSDSIFLDLNLSIYRLHEHLRSLFMGHSLLLFPYLKGLVACKTGQSDLHRSPFFGKLRQAIGPEIEKTGSLLETLREKISAFSSAEEMGETGRRLFEKLTAFTDDLQTLLFLEKEILLPKAEALERECCENGVAACQNHWFG